MIKGLLLIFVICTTILYFFIEYGDNATTLSRWKQLISLAESDSDTKKYCFCTEKLHDGKCVEKILKDKILYEETQQQRQPNFEFLEDYCNVKTQQGIVIPEKIVCPENESKFLVANMSHTIEFSCNLFNNNNRIRKLLLSAFITSLGMAFIGVSIKF